MLIELYNARLCDPTRADAMTSKLSSLWIEDDRILSTPASPSVIRKADQRLDLKGGLVMAGGIDIHTHIGGGKVNLARMLMPSSPDSARADSTGSVVWSTQRTGELYAQMGYTTCCEPAMLLSSARHTHLELADTPYLDTAALVVLGNEEWLLSAMGKRVEYNQLRDLVAWSVKASQALGIKVVNAGGISAFKFNGSRLDVDQPHPAYGVTPRDVIRFLANAANDLGLAHPLHVHASNLGVPGNIASTLATLEAAEGQRLHLTHAQFNCYTGDFVEDDVRYSMGSGAEQLSRYVNSHSNISIDVGQIVFGQTVTISADEAAQYNNRLHARPRKWLIGSTECQAGCGVVPMRYSDTNYVHSLQWTIGLELMLLIDDPWRVFLTTDHPNGGPFTSYPHLIRLLMDRTFRLSMVERLHPLVAKRTLLRELDREYSLDEIAIITRAAPAKILGLSDRGGLSAGMKADLVVYTQENDWESTFSNARMVFKAGQKIVNDGKLSGLQSRCETLVASHPASPTSQAELSPKWCDEIQQRLRVSARSLLISENELQDIRS